MDLKSNGKDFRYGHFSAFQGKNAYFPIDTVVSIVQQTRDYSILLQKFKMDKYEYIENYYEN